MANLLPALLLSGALVACARSAPTELVLPFWAGTDVRASGSVVSLREHHACSGTIAYARVTRVSSFDDSEMLVPERVVEFDVAGAVVREWPTPVEPFVLGVRGEELWIRNPDPDRKAEHLAIQPDGTFRPFDAELEPRAAPLPCPVLREFGETAYLRCWLYQDSSDSEDRRIAYQGPCT